MPVQRSLLGTLLVLATVTASAAGQSPSRAALVARLDSIAAAPVKSGTVAGMAVAVVKGRDTFLMKGYGLADIENQVAVTPQTVFRIGSITKQFTSSAVMQLVQDGKLGLDDDIAAYGLKFPTHGRKILLRHLLNHTSGIPSYTDVGPVFGTIMRQDLARDSLIGVVANDSLMFEPGTHFYYNNTGYFMLGMIIEKTTGMKYGDWLDQRLFAPNGLGATTYCGTRKLISHRAAGYDRTPAGFANTDFISMELPFAAGSLCSTVGDLVAWTGKLHEGGIVNAASFREMTTPVKLPSGRPMNYGFGLSVDTVDGHRVVAHGGGINGFISYLAHFPDDRLSVVVLANTTPAPSDQVADALARAVLGVAPRAAPPPPKDLPLTAVDRVKYVGRYALTRPNGSKVGVRVFEQADSLMLQQDGQAAATRLASQGGDVFTARGMGRVAFDVAGDRATGFVAGGGSRSLEAVRVP
ncbi:MAG: serine hydrolase domain-containing protein [Gemmatimonadota bacterium]|nr:serine hydrolase domain-containing protein [Gemmatimonadota bacterium]